MPKVPAFYNLGLTLTIAITLCSCS